MKIFLEIKNVRTGFRLADYVTFDILSCCAPTNLWVLKDCGEEKVNGMTFLDFTYKKVVSLMEVSAIIDGKEMHGQVVSVATGNEDHLYNVVISLGEEYTDYEWEQRSFIRGDGAFHIIDMDELRQSKEYKDRPIDECFLELLNPPIGYHIMNDRYVTEDGEILNASEYLDKKGE